MKAIFEMGYWKPSIIQKKGIVPILEGHDVIIQSPSGTGKTACFCIPALEKIDK